MSEAEVENHLKRYLQDKGGSASAREIVGTLQQETKVSASTAKMTLLRLANRSEVRVRPDLTVELAVAR